MSIAMGGALMIMPGLFESAESEAALSSSEDLFRLLECTEEEGDSEPTPFASPLEEAVVGFRGGGGNGGGGNQGRSSKARLASEMSDSLAEVGGEEGCGGDDAIKSPKRAKMSKAEICGVDEQTLQPPLPPQNRMLHITVERNRRKQMNEHLMVLRSLMPSFYVKRGDQASIIGGVVDYIKELQQVLQSLEAKKQRKSFYSDPAAVFGSCNSATSSPRTVISSLSSPRSGNQLTPLSPSPLSPSPRLPPMSPRMGLPPISPRTPQPGSPYKPAASPRTLLPQHQHALAALSCLDPLPSWLGLDAVASASSTTSTDLAAAKSRSAAAEVEVRLAGPNVVLKTVSNRIPGQPVKIIATLERLELEILHVAITTVDDTMLNSFTIKIGIECELSAEELAQEIQKTFN